MDEDMSGLVPREGMTVVGWDGERIGEIDLVEANYFIVKRGGVFPQDHYFAMTDIVAQDADGALRLSMPAEEAIERSLGNPSAAISDEHATDPGTATLDTAETAHDDVAVADLDTPPAGEPPVEDVTDEAMPEPLHADGGDVEIDDVGEPARDDDMHRTVALSEEELSVSTRPVDRGVVRVQKTITEEKQTFEVPLREEEVHVTRRRVDRDITNEDAAFEEDHIEIPLRGQGVEIEKQAHVVEEIEIHKTAHRQIREVTETVRRETARVEGDNLEEITDEVDAPQDEDEPLTT